MKPRLYVNAPPIILVWVVAGVLLAGCAAGPPAPPPDDPDAYSDEQLQALLEGVTNGRGDQVRIDDPRGTVSGADGGTYTDSSDPRYNMSLHNCELHQTYLVFNTVSGRLATGLFLPSTLQGQEDLKDAGNYQNISVIDPGPEVNSEFQQRLAAYQECEQVAEILRYASNRLELETNVVRLPATIAADQSFAVSQLLTDQPHVGTIFVGASKGGVDVLYSQDVSGDSPAVDFEAAAAEGADIVNQVLAKIP